MLPASSPRAGDADRTAAPTRAADETRIVRTSMSPPRRASTRLDPRYTNGVAGSNCGCAPRSGRRELFLVDPAVGADRERTLHRGRRHLVVVLRLAAVRELARRHERAQDRPRRLALDALLERLERL